MEITLRCKRSGGLPWQASDAALRGKKSQSGYRISVDDGIIVIQAN